MKNEGRTTVFCLCLLQIVCYSLVAGAVLCRTDTQEIRDAEPRHVWERCSVRTALKWKPLRLSSPGALQGNSGRLRGVSHLMMCKAASALICRSQPAWKSHSLLSFRITSTWYLPEQCWSLRISDREPLFIYHTSGAFMNKPKQCRVNK